MVKTAVVTGTSSGIGKAIADTLLGMGYKVYGVSRSISKNDNPGFVWIQGDLTDRDTFDRIARSVTEDAIDLLVNNAGIAFESSALDFDEEDFERLFSINFKAPIFLARALRGKIQNGLVINISSVSDRLVGEQHALYCSSKAALNTYFDVVALEEKNMRVVSVLPSYVDTPLLRKLHADNKDFDWNAPMKPEEIAEFIGQIAGSAKSLPSGARVIAVSDALKEDLEYSENLWGYNATSKNLFRLTRRQSQK